MHGALSKARLVSAACVLAALSGAASLAHQMIWTRRLVDLLGASPLTFSKVVGAFFLGLSVGAALAALRSSPVRHPWRWVALVEVAIAGLALPALLTPHVTEWLYQSPQFGGWFKQLIPFLFVTPPAIAMGMVISWMIRALAADLPVVGNTAVWMYATNTLGGVVGVIGVLLFALPKLGLTGAGLALCGVNLSIALGALWLGQSVTEKSPNAQAILSPAAKASPPPASEVWRFPTIPVVAFFSGFLVLAAEVVLQHQFAQVTINSFFSSGTVLAWGLFALAVGSALAPGLAWLVSDSATRLRAVLLAAAGLFVIQPFLFTWLRDGVQILPYELPPAAYTWAVGKLALVTLCPLFVVAGLLFPLLLQQAASGTLPGRQVAVLLAWNGLGGWAGSEIGQLFIAPQFGLWRSLVVIGLAYAGLAVVVSLPAAAELGKSQRSLVPRWMALPVGGLAVWLFILAGPLPQVSVNPGENLAAVRVGREGVVATIECGPGDWRMLFNNSYTLGGSKARSNQERQAHLPILLHGQARSVGILGVATGGTVAGASLHPGVERIDAAELSPLVLQQAGSWFDAYSRTTFQNPRVHLHTEDARWMVATKSNAYDVVIGDLFLPWRTGEGRLFSVEHFQAVRRALKADGVFCQWLPLFQLTQPQFEVIVRSFQQVFPDVMVVRGDFYAELPVLGLIGGRTVGQLDWQQIGAACTALRATGVVTDPLVRHAEGVAMMVVGQLPEADAGPVNTLANAWLEWDCGRNILGMRTPWFIGVPEAEFVQAIHRAAQPLLPPELRSAHDAGQFFLTLEIAAKLQLPLLPNFTAQIPGRLPAPLWQDPEVSWQEWPMRIKPAPINDGAVARPLTNKTFGIL